MAAIRIHLKFQFLHGCNSDSPQISVPPWLLFRFNSNLRIFGSPNDDLSNSNMTSEFKNKPDGWETTSKTQDGRCQKENKIS
ncbi:hypothetical protein P3L10_015483 [Capsicum annuum]